MKWNRVESQPSRDLIHIHLCSTLGWFVDLETQATLFSSIFHREKLLGATSVNASGIETVENAQMKIL